MDVLNRQRLPIFAGPAVAQIVLDSWRCLREEHRLEIYAYVIMENHLHLIASSEQLSKEIGDFKSFTARKIIDFLVETNAQHFLGQLVFHKLQHKMDRSYQFWQEGSHPQLIQGEDMMRQKIEYIHENPVRRGYVDDPTHWRYSSARDYVGQPGLFDVSLAW
ncbi:MAG: transposase [Candidatus Latescibacterota bacterium]